MPPAPQPYHSPHARNMIRVVKGRDARVKKKTRIHQRIGRPLATSALVLSAFGAQFGYLSPSGILTALASIASYTHESHVRKKISKHATEAIERILYRESRKNSPLQKFLLANPYFTVSPDGMLRGWANKKQASQDKRLVFDSERVWMGLAEAAHQHRRKFGLNKKKVKRK